jgi:hypothetical protein
MPTIPSLRPRNPVALSPLLRKGGVHERSKSGVRSEVKQLVQEEIGEWSARLDEWDAEIIDDILIHSGHY